MPDKNKQSKSQWVVILSCTMAGLAIGMMLMQQFRFNAAEGVRLGTMFGGIGTSLGALAGQVIVWLKKLSRQPADQPEEPEGFGDVPIARPVRSSELQPGESALPIVEIDETTPVSSRRGEAQRAGASKSPNSVVPDVVVAVVGAVIGIVLLAITATNALVPVVAAAMVGTLAYAVGNERFRPMVPAFAAQAGHLAWMVLSALLLNQWAPVGVDVVILGAGLLWLAVHPGLAPVIVLSIYQAILFGMNMHSLETCSVVNLELALSVHMVLRGFALAALWIGWLRIYLLAKRQPVELPARVISDRGIEAGSDVATGQYEQLEPFDDASTAPATTKTAMNPALASAYLAGAATAAAGLYATLVVWHWMAWGMLVTCLALIAASVAKFVAYQRQSIDRKTVASETWSYTGLAANVVSLLLIACIITASVVRTPTVARRPAAQPPSFGAGPPSKPNSLPSTPQETAAEKENRERIRRMQEEAAAERERRAREMQEEAAARQAADEARRREQQMARQEAQRQAAEKRAADAALRQAEAARKREEERQAALKPKWHPFRSVATRPGQAVAASTDRERPKDVDPAQRDLVVWKGVEDGFHITSLRIRRAWSQSGRERRLPGRVMGSGLHRDSGRLDQ